MSDDDEHRAEVLILGTADWNQPIATNQHYVARALTDSYNANITFVESLGLRRPQLNARDLRRVVRRLSRAINEASTSEHTNREVPSGMRVASPIIVPYHSGLTRRLNSHLLRSQISSWTAARGRRVLWTYTPVTYGLDSIADTAVYHCVDLLGQFPGIDANTIASAEAELAARNVAAVASSEKVADHLAAMGFRNIELWPNVADTAIFSAREPQRTERTEERAIFAGNLTANKVDFNLLLALVNSGLTLDIAGPIAEGGGATPDQFRELLRAGANYLGVLSLEELAQHMTKCTVGLIPYVFNEYTAGVSPLKTYEYLAAGLAVASIGVPSVQAVPGMVYVATTKQDFLRAARRAAAIPTENMMAHRIRLASEHSWQKRSAQAREKAGL